VLLYNLQCLWREKVIKGQRKWKRTLPFADYLVDRWEKAEYLGFGEGTSIYDSSLVLGEVKVGRNTWIGPFTVLDGTGGLEIEDNCSISAGVQIYSYDTVKWSISGGNDEYEKEKTVVGNNCYFGPNVVVAKGVVIGNQCVIGANSFVNRNIPDNSRAFGTPVIIK
jgi:acetyltransferase-like isoleucine patch superfamily enzyme